MKKFSYLFSIFILYFLAASSIQALSLKELKKFDLSLQYRVMYNNSNMPGSGGSTFTDHRDYDFFRQRFRLALDVQPSERIGGFVELEFRGGWGVGPDISDPREDLSQAVAFNRLKARGIRYGYVYAILGKEQKLIKLGIRSSAPFGILMLEEFLLKEILARVNTEWRI
jgi:hypothetical protein